MCNIGIQQSLGISVCDPEILKSFPPEQVSDICGQEFVICLLESLFSELEHCIIVKHILCDPAHERGLVTEVSSLIFDSQTESPRTIKELLTLFAKMHRRIAEFIRRRFIYRENVTVPIATLDIEALKHIVELVKKTVPSLKNSTFIALLDEYENLFPYQQRIVNTFVKLSAPAMSVKVAKKLGTADISATTIGQELQEIHDYSRLALVYDVEDPKSFKAYKELLEHIVNNIFINEGLPPRAIIDLLPEYVRQDLEVTEDKLVESVAHLCKVKVDDFKKWDENQRQEKVTYYGEAAIYRNIYARKGRQPEKRFAGFKELAFLSSGVIRYFQEMLGVAYYLSLGNSLPTEALTLPPQKRRVFESMTSAVV